MPFRILISNSNPPDLWGGGEMWLMDMARDLRDEGHHVTINSHRESRLYKEARKANIDACDFGIRSNIDFLRAPYFALKVRKYDVIVTNIVRDVKTVGLAGKLAGVPVIISRQGMILVGPKKRHGLYMKLVDVILTNNHTQKAIYDSYPWMTPGKVRVIYNRLRIQGEIEPYDLKRHLGIPDDSTLLISVGRLSGMKGFDLLLPAIASVADRYPGLHLAMLGTGPLKDDLERLRKELGLENRVHFMGYRESPWPMIQAADALVLSSRIEGFPSVVLEAMALKTPVLATNVGGIREFVRDGVNGYVIPQVTSEAMADTITRYLESPRDHQKIVDNAYRMVYEEFSREKTLSQMNQLMQEIYDSKW